MPPVIVANHLSKKYVINHASGGYVALRDVLADQFKRVLKRKADVPAQEDFYALRDVSFEVNQGDRVGIIGRNGAGKSTLLKILSRITEPTSGNLKIKGRVASLLEVGTGFHPELTGRENIFLNGAILGMSRAEILRNFDEIVAFAEVEKFLDTPVKRYSSGMYVRLAFAVAAHLEPEILVVDEVLAVGDINFRKKCMGKMRDIAHETGKTILFVSHDMAAIQSLCNKAMVLKSGQIDFTGLAQPAIDHYLVSTQAVTNTKLEWVSQAQEAFSDVVKIKRYAVLDSQGCVCENQLRSSGRYRIVIEANILKPDPNLVFFISLYLEDGTLVFVSDAYDHGLITPTQIKAGSIELSLALPTQWLANRSYILELSCVIHYKGWVLPFNNEESRLRFDFYRDDHSNVMYESNHPRTNGLRPGILAPILEWQISQ